MRLFFILLTLTFLLALLGCNQELKDGYQFGDITHYNARKLDAIHQHRVNYCSAYSNSTTRQIALTAIRAQYPLVPKDGICIGLTSQETLSPPETNPIRAAPG